MAARTIADNRRYSYSRYRTGTSLQLRLMRRIFTNVNDINLYLMIFPCMSLHCKLVSVQYQEYDLMSPHNTTSEFQNTVVLNQIATKTNISYQFLPVNYILGCQMPPNSSDFSNTFFSERIKTKINACKAFWSTESLLSRERFPQKLSQDRVQGQHPLAHL